MGVDALVGSRVVLRALREEDVPGIGAWFGDAAAAAYEERSVEGIAADGDAFTILESGADEAIGLVEYDSAGGWLTVRFIALAKAYRGWGYGSEAVRLVEEWALRKGVAERFRAEVAVRNGLGLYFWLRLGYRPATTREFDWQTDEVRDKMPMVREVSSGMIEG
jgi:RimJ/RimL family protein N-acetyltransferase